MGSDNCDSKMGHMKDKSCDSDHKTKDGVNHMDTDNTKGSMDRMKDKAYDLADKAKDGMHNMANKAENAINNAKRKMDDRDDRD